MCPSERPHEFFYRDPVAADLGGSIKKTKHWTEKDLHCTLKNVTRCFDRKTVMELCNKINQPSVEK